MRGIRGQFGNERRKCRARIPDALAYIPRRLKGVRGEVGATFKMDIMWDKAQESVLLLFYFFILAG